MANFLITTANSLYPGTSANDYFELRTALGVTIQAGLGNDTITASGTNFANAQFGGGQGDDVFVLTGEGAKNLANTKVLAGAGNDTIALDDATTVVSTIFGGGGADVINVSGGTFTNATINGGQGLDLISAVAADYENSFVAVGGGDDTIFVTGGRLSASTFNGGGGNDRLTFIGVDLSGSEVYGSLNAGQSFGNDSIRFSGGTLRSTLVNGGNGNDNIIVSSTHATGVTIGGNQGNDSIFLDQFVVSGSTFVGGGAGLDTIVVSGALVSGFGTIQGGGGADVINVSGAGATGGFIFGQAEADAIGLGTLAINATGNGVASGVNVGYASFAESNLAGFDTISAAVAGGAGTGAFMITQSAVNFSVAAFDRPGVVTGGITGGATFTGGFDASLTARAAALDLALVQGQAVVFQDGPGTNFLFVQGGATGGGTADDMVIQLNAGFNNTTTGGLYRVNDSALKVVIG